MKGGSRGRQATWPWQLSLRGWRDAILRLLFWRMSPAWTVSAAGIAFFATLALFPGLAAVASVYGLLFDLEDVLRQVSALEAIAPPEVIEVIRTRLVSLAEQGSQALSIGLGISTVGALWGASRATRAMIEGLNVVYGEVERRHPLVKAGVGLLLATVSSLLVVVVLALSGGVPVVMSLFGLESSLGLALSRWLLLAVLVLSVVAILYRYGPCRSRALWRWVLPGALTTTVGLLLGSWGLTTWSAHFDSFEATYGALGTLGILMLWLYLGAQVVLISGALNAELERQTEHDTTVGKGQPAGERGAWASDSLGPRPARLLNLVLGKDPQALDDEGEPVERPAQVEQEGRRSRQG